MAPVRERPSPIDRFTGASASAIMSGFSAAMALGPQPKGGPTQQNPAPKPSEGMDWLRNLKQVSGMNGTEGGPRGEMSAAHGATGSRLGEDDDLSEDDDGDSEIESPDWNGKKKAKKNKSKAKTSKAVNDDSTAAQRKAQNRIAQREFRQRKQQYIRALEARVELLSSDHDTQVERLRYALRGLLAENNQLRSILGGFASFVGKEMMGGPLQKSGVSRPELEELIEYSSEKTLTEAWMNWPGAKECEELRQIRLESNLPPEGLPESYKLPEHAIANTLAKQTAAAATSSSATSTEADKRIGPKRKGTAEEELTSKVSKRKQLPKASVGQVPETEASHSRQNSSTLPDVSQFYDTQTVAHMNNYFTQHSQMSNDFSLPNQYPPFSGSEHGNQISSSQQPQMSDVIWASLFGPDVMGDALAFHRQQSSSAPTIQAMNTSSDSPIYMNGLRQKAVTSSSEESEEIKRISGFAAVLRKDTLRFTEPKDNQELTRVVEGLSRLIQEMATFRQQPSYQLPSLLEPNEIQQTRPHDPLIDALPFSGLRPNLIEHQDNLVLDDVFIALLYHTQIHPGEVTVESNWEIKEGFILAYPQLIDRQTLATANHWRATRDESVLDYKSLSVLVQ